MLIDFGRQIDSVYSCSPGAFWGPNLTESYQLTECEWGSSTVSSIPVTGHCAGSLALDAPPPVARRRVRSVFLRGPPARPGAWALGTTVQLYSLY